MSTAIAANACPAFEVSSLIAGVVSGSRTGRIRDATYQGKSSPSGAAIRQERRNCNKEQRRATDLTIEQQNQTREIDGETGCPRATTENRTRSPRRTKRTLYRRQVLSHYFKLGQAAPLQGKKCLEPHPARNSPDGGRVHSSTAPSTSWVEGSSHPTLCWARFEREQ